ncbi:hypothetical protein OAory_01089570 [Aspergillus oryzae]|uniref:Uncharacterized protein n=5 Tax=Aspergillus subgen. Circumdati TaxID=2720871 RepID=A0A1S9DD00_ASPOZ|nr:hypothetical protein OAory_01089570 [Aspergillus oryzae]
MEQARQGLPITNRAPDAKPERASGARRENQLALSRRLTLFLSPPIFLLSSYLVICLSFAFRVYTFNSNTLVQIKTHLNNNTSTFIMSTTTTSVAASATASCNSVTYWQLPVDDAACALPKTGNYSDVMDKCCSPAKVTDFDNGCGLYCLAQGQSVGDLKDCLRKNGAQDGREFYCKGNDTATATASAPSSTKTGDKTGTATGSGASSTSSDSAAYAIQPAVSKGGLGLLAMVFCSALMGVVA